MERRRETTHKAPGATGRSPNRELPTAAPPGTELCFALRPSAGLRPPVSVSVSHLHPDQHPQERRPGCHFPGPGRCIHHKPRGGGGGGERGSCCPGTRPPAQNCCWRRPLGHPPRRRPPTGAPPSPLPAVHAPGVAHCRRSDLPGLTEAPGISNRLSASRPRNCSCVFSVFSGAAAGRAPYSRCATWWSHPGLQHVRHQHPLVLA